MDDISLSLRGFENPPKLLRKQLVKMLVAMTLATLPGIASAIIPPPSVCAIRLPAKQVVDEYFAENAKLKQLAEADSSSEVLQRDLSVSYIKIGDMHKLKGEPDNALQAYKNSVTISEKLLDAAPTQPERLRDLPMGYERIGDFYLEQKNTREALVWYERSFGITERLQALLPEDVGVQRELSVSYNKMGNLYATLGDLKPAIDIYLKALPISEKLLERNPNNIGLLRDLSVNYNMLGDLYSGVGDVQNEQKWHQSALAFNQNLLGLDQERKAEYLVRSLKILQKLQARVPLSATQANLLKSIDAQFPNGIPPALCAIR
jgi:tetratricopeptide (TPR) repeat protein